MKLSKSMKKLLAYIPASFIYSIGVSLFLDPNDLAPGGITGISILLNRFLPIETGTLILVLNIPLLIIALRKFGLKFVLSTFYVLALIAVCSNFLSRLEPLCHEPLLAAVGGGTMMAIGLGIILRCGATTGGTDIVVMLLRLKFRHLRTGSLFLTIDILIISLSMLVFRNMEQAMYAGISLYIMTRLLDVVLYGTDEAKLIYIISNEPERIASEFLQTLDIGVTYLKGSGAYTNTDKRVIMCVVKKRIAPSVVEIVKASDPNAFMIIGSANEIYGEGYKSYHNLTKF